MEEECSSTNLNVNAHLFLTSSTGEIIYENGIITTKGFFKINEFENNLKKIWKRKSKVLYITADPNSQETNNSITLQNIYIFHNKNKI